MPNSLGEPANLVLEHLRLMRAETNARFDLIDADIKQIKTDISDIKKDVRGLELDTIAEAYKANLTVMSFVDHEQCIQALERKSS